MTVSDLFIYPIKSCGGIRVKDTLVEKRGLAFDRRWMLVDERNRFISQRENAALALLDISIENNQLIVSKRFTDQRILVPLLTNTEINDAERLSVTIWEDECLSIEIDKKISNDFSQLLGMTCKLVYMPEDCMRQIDEKYATKGDITSFSDGYPILLLGQSTLDNLNNKLETPITINRFRPNLVFTGGFPHQEDEFKNFQINDALFEGVKPCKRCIIPNIDQHTALAGNEPTATLVKYRLHENKVLFGQNVLVKKTGTISFGDIIQF